MAKTISRSQAPIIIQAPARRRASAIVRRVGAAAKKHGKRVGTAGIKAAWKRRAMIAAGAVGAGMGYIQKNGIEVPAFGPLGKNGTIAAALVALTMVTRNEWLDHAAAAAVGVAAYDWQATGSIHGGYGGGAGVGRYSHLHRVIDGAR